MVSRFVSAQEISQGTGRTLGAIRKMASTHGWARKRDGRQVLYALQDVRESLAPDRATRRHLLRRYDDVVEKARGLR